MSYSTEYAGKVKELAQSESRCFFGEYDVDMYANFHKKHALDILTAFLWLTLVAATNFLYVHFIVTVLLLLAILASVLPLLKLLFGQPKEIAIARVCYGVFFVVIYLIYAYRGIDDITYIWSLTVGFSVMCAYGLLFHSRKHKEVMRFNALQKRCEALANGLMAQKAGNADGMNGGRHYWWEVSRDSVNEYSRRFGKLLGKNAKVMCKQVEYGLAADAIKSESTPFIPLANDAALEEGIKRLKSSALGSNRSEDIERQLRETLSAYRFYFVSSSEAVTHSFASEKTNDELNAEVGEKMRAYSDRMDWLERFSNDGVFTDKEMYYSGRDGSTEMRSRTTDRDILDQLMERDFKKTAEASRMQTHRYREVVYHNIGYCITTDEPKPRLLAILPIYEDSSVSNIDWSLLVIRSALSKIPGITFDIYESTPENGNSLYQAYAVYFHG